MSEILDRISLYREVCVPDGGDLIHPGTNLAPHLGGDDTDKTAYIFDYPHLMNSMDFIINGCMYTSFSMKGTVFLYSSNMLSMA